MAALWWLCGLSVAVAWDKDGHEAIGMTIMSALQHDPVHEVKRLMHGKDTVDVAAWAHKVNKKYPWTLQLHFQEGCEENKCLVQALHHFYGKLTHKPSADIDWGSLKLTDADRLKYLINLMGDLHQPLHVELEGRNASMFFRGKTMTLFDFWDKELVQATMQENPSFWWGGWTHVQRIRAQFENDASVWKEKETEMFTVWADETANFARRSVYTNPVTGRPLLEHQAAGPVRIDEALFQAWKRDMLNRVLLAGARTAIVLNSILQHREAHDLKDGSVLEDEEDKKPRVTRVSAGLTQSHGHITGIQALGINMSIFVIVLALFLYVQKIWQGDVAEADRAKQASGGKKI
mmetsp:Transcript_49801/g.132095  ORF Transcript_49801/g.132095 Transcript_49801/m.132095 type:complete len:348 (-) Transcript_49801:39-1082(-)